MIADSVGGALTWQADARAAFSHGLDVDLEVKTCRKLATPGCAAYGDDGPESALATIQRLGGALGSTVVIDVGYNDTVPDYAAGIDRVLQALADAGVQHVVWVTLAERIGVWPQTNAVIRQAASRWPALVIADWDAASAGHDWFVDTAHLNAIGAVALGTFLRPIVLGACGEACIPPPTFCGLAWTVNGFDPVSAVSELDCNSARAAVIAIERGQHGDWECTRAVRASYTLDCKHGWQEVQILERSPIDAVRHAGVVTLANWTFRIARGRLEARSGAGPWHVIARRAPFCVPAAPREVLLALDLRPSTRNSGCFAP
ncbi:MAG: hypothetical protein ACJ76I_09485 [Gaiellaceae bacterium]